MSTMKNEPKAAHPRRHVGTAYQDGGWVVFFAMGRGFLVRYIAKTAKGEQSVTREAVDKALRENSK